MEVHSPLVGSCALVEIRAFADFLFRVYCQLGLADFSLKPLDSHHYLIYFSCLFG